MEPYHALKSNIQRVFMGKAEAVERVIICLLAQGHVLIEDVPGVGKTVLASALARSIDCSMTRIQLTPDMLPGDILGVTVWDQHKSDFVFKPGPIFAHIVLADEINRTTPRTQSALLEAMNEAQVSVDGVTRRLDPPFLVIATQNPYEFEGTYFLPESQLDRFMMRLHLGYPAFDDEVRVLATEPSRKALRDLTPVMSIEDLLEAQARVHEVKVDTALVEYVVAMARATRENDHVETGVSTRGSLSLMMAARATALYNGRDYVIPEDIVSNVLPVWAHRIATRTNVHDSDSMGGSRIVREIIESVAAPV